MRFLILTIIAFLGPFAGSSVAQNNPPIIEVLAYNIPGKAFMTPEGEIQGDWITEVRSFLDTKDVHYTIRFLPWTRVVREAKASDSALVLALIRNPERENSFFWIHRLANNSSELLVRADSATTFETVTDEPNMALCKVSSGQCQVFKTMGFPPERILQISESSTGNLARLMLAKRADVMIADKNILAAELVNIGYDINELKSLGPLNIEGAFLTAYKTIRPDILERLKASE